MASRPRGRGYECLDYLEQVRDGRIAACKKMVRLAEIMVPRIGDGYKRWHYDPGYASRPVEFIEKFCCLPSGRLGAPFVLEPFQKAAIQLLYGFVDDDGMRQFHEALWVWGRKNSKALSLDTPIPTPDGYKAMGEIHAGSTVFGLDGKPVTVIAESEIFNKPMYEVRFEDGETIKASADHIWTVQTKRSRRAVRRNVHRSYLGHEVNDNGEFDITTEEMFRRGVFRTRPDGKGVEYEYRVPMGKPVEYDEKDLPIDPYLLGVWLGDGYSEGNNISVGAQDIDEMMELLAEFNPQAAERGAAYFVKVGEFFVDEHGFNHNTVNDALRELNLIGNKHIPGIYLHASTQQRIALLQGLMDTDGSISKAGQCEFSQKEHRLLEDMIELVSGLGIKCDYGDVTTICNRKRFPSYKLRFFVDKTFPCFRLPRKAARLKDRLAPRMRHKSITSIRPIPSEPSKCIAVDSPDHLYLCGRHYTATHNSTTGAALELYMLMGDGEGSPQVYNVANSRPQASLAYGACLKMMKHSPLLRKRLHKGIVPERGEDGIMFDANSGYITTLSSQTRCLDGLDIHFALIDELAASVNRGIYDDVKQGTSARDQPIVLSITTNGFQRDGIFDDRYDYGSHILTGEVEDDRFLPMIYELDERGEWTDEGCWVKANPGLGPIKKLDALRDFVNEAKQNPSFLPTVLTKDFNVPENKAAAWLTFEEAVNNDTFDVSEMGFRYGIAGFDASDTTDLSAATLMMMRPGDERIYELHMAWLPEDSLRDDGLRTERDDVPYFAWEKRGLLRLVPGNKVPKQVFLDWLDEIKEQLDIWTFAIGYDRWGLWGTDEMNFQQYVGKDNCEPIAQGPKTLSNPMKMLRADMRGNRLVDNGNPLAQWCRMNVSVKTDVNGNIQPVKSEGKAKNRIDMFMSELHAYITLLQHEDSYRSLI